MKDLWRADFFLAASKMVEARRALGDELEGSYLTRAGRPESECNGETG